MNTKKTVRETVRETLEIMNYDMENFNEKYNRMKTNSIHHENSIDFLQFCLDQWGA